MVITVSPVDRRSDPMPHQPVALETIAVTIGRLQHSSIRAERLANRRYVNLERIFLDNRARPYAAHKFVFGDKLALRPNQNVNNFECRAADCDRNSPHAKFTASEIDLPVPRLVNQSSARYVLSRHSRSPDVFDPMHVARREDRVFLRFRG